VQPTSAQFSLTLRVRIDHRPGMLGRVATAIGQAGGTIGDVELVEFDRRHTLRDMTVDAGDEEHERRIVDAVRAVDGAQVVDWTDRTLGMHVGGKLEVALRHPLRTADDLSMAYTPGVARVCGAIAADPDRAFQYTIERNTVAVVSDGTAVLGLGDIGPAAAMPVMEGKAMLFKEFAGVDAFPICLDTKETDAIVATVKVDRARLRRHQPRDPVGDRPRSRARGRRSRRARGAPQRLGRGRRGRVRLRRGRDGRIPGGPVVSAPCA
jgi:malate dehydrogenase (oxaloacetate-decarboxylating)